MHDAFREESRLGLSHQHTRVAQADRAIRDRVRTCPVAGSEPLVARLLAPERRGAAAPDRPGHALAPRGRAS